MNKLAPLLLAFVVLFSGCVSQYQVPTPPTKPEVTPTPTPSQAPPSVPTPAVKEFKITIDHNGGYSLNKISVNKGDTVKILAISNQPSHQHGITIDTYNINKAVLKNLFTSPDVIEFTADKSGTFEIYCKTCETGPLGAHPWMKGTLEVK